MTFKVAIIADDLTGALDTGTPFVAAGLTVAVAVDVAALPEAIARMPDVIVVNTASRALAAAEAAARIAKVMAALRPAVPAIVFKKIDSRLRGNIAAESTALARETGRNRIIVAPAVPDQQRFTIDGAVTGRGVEPPLSVRSHFSEAFPPIDVCDAMSDADLDRLVARTDWSGAIAVGARGLGSAFARFLQRPGQSPAIHSPSRATFFAFGSRDPITSAQIAYLLENCPDITLLEAPDGALSIRPDLRLPAIARCCGDQTAKPQQVARRFAEGIRASLDVAWPEMMLMGGGDTAHAILLALGAGVLVPVGELEAGIPWFTVEGPDGRTLRCAVKSGGFGQIDSLFNLLPANLLNLDKSGRTMIERQAW